MKQFTHPPRRDWEILADAGLNGKKSEKCIKHVNSNQMYAQQVIVLMPLLSQYFAINTLLTTNKIRTLKFSYIYFYNKRFIHFIKTNSLKLFLQVDSNLFRFAIHARENPWTAYGIVFMVWDNVVRYFDREKLVNYFEVLYISLEFLKLFNFCYDLLLYFFTFFSSKCEVMLGYQHFYIYKDKKKEHRYNLRRKLR